MPMVTSTNHQQSPWNHELQSYFGHHRSFLSRQQSSLSIMCSTILASQITWTVTGAIHSLPKYRTASRRNWVYQSAYLQPIIHKWIDGWIERIKSQSHFSRTLTPLIIYTRQASVGKHVPAPGADTMSELNLSLQIYTSVKHTSITKDIWTIHVFKNVSPGMLDCDESVTVISCITPKAFHTHPHPFCTIHSLFLFLCLCLNT